MQHRVEVTYRGSYKDPDGVSVLSDICDLGISSVDDVRTICVYIIDGEVEGAQLGGIAGSLLSDPVVQQHRICGPDQPPWPWVEGGDVRTIEISRKQGVMDPVQQSAMKAIADLGLAGGVESIRTARKYSLRGHPSSAEMERIALRILANTTIEEVHIDEQEVHYPLQRLAYEFELRRIPLGEADDRELMRISREGQLSLTLGEMKTIQARYGELDRDPTDLELEILAQMWSEHCVHKTLRGHVTYEGPVPQSWQDRVGPDGKLVLDNMLKETIARATAELDRPWCVSVFEDNAGVIEFADGWNVCFKVETHNHPSAIEPYGGANTGIGGVIRDPLGTGLGARPIMNTDVFCFGPPDLPEDGVPPGALHPARLMKGVVAGVRDYGNRMGIPTVNGAVYFDERYIGNPLVYCGDIGLMPHEKMHKEAHSGDLILVVGGRTGRDGIHGATFSSVELTSESETISSGAVQIGNPITEKKVLDTLMQARDRGLYSCITDCGAGGLSCAVAEMGAEVGAEVEIRDVPLKYEGLSYTEIWISEAQERMVLAVPPEKLDEIMHIFAGEDVEATVIGRFTGDRALTVKYGGEVVAHMQMDFVHNGLPRFRETARWQRPHYPDPLVNGSWDDADEKTREACEKVLAGFDECTWAVEQILAAPNVRSKEWIVRQYDHEVQGQTVVKPLVGVDNDGPGDGCVCAPLLGSDHGVAVACGLNPKYGDIDTYHSAASAIDEALRNITAVGGSIERTAILDNFCWGNTRKPEQLGTLVRACLACYDCAVAFGVPFISGKDSLNNEFNTGEEVITIPPTLLISAICVIEDIRRCITADLKEAGNRLYLVGCTYPEFGGSHYLDLFGLTGQTVPEVRAEQARTTMLALAGAIGEGLVRSCHDLSEGGLGVAAAESAFAGGMGLDLDLSAVPYEGPSELKRDDVLLFSESNSRFLVEVRPEDASRFEKRLADAPVAHIGAVKKNGVLRAAGIGGKEVVCADTKRLKAAWQTPFFAPRRPAAQNAR